MKEERIVIAGGGAAGFFAAIASAEARPKNEVVILERGSQFLTKVRISGGGRCNVTHTALDPRRFAARYPRGERALLGALHRFSPEDTIAWFEKRGVRLKTEEDGRIFPVTDSSGTVIDCLLHEAKMAGVNMFARRGLVKAVCEPAGGFALELSDRSAMKCDRLLLATGGTRAVNDAEIANSLGHTAESPVPSLFSFHVPTAWLRLLPGVSLEDAELTVEGTKLRERGPLLITHHGVSGPGVLRLSAWGARILAEMDYKFVLRINWLPSLTADALNQELNARRSTSAKRRVANFSVAPLPVRLWEQLVSAAAIPAETLWAEFSRANSLALVRQIQRTEFNVDGKTLNKDEFVSCGGIRLAEVDFKTMESRIVPHLYFAGELLDLDGITGGFNFQAAWSTAWIAGHAMADAAGST